MTHPTAIDVSADIQQTDSIVDSAITALSQVYPGVWHRIEDKGSPLTLLLDRWAGVDLFYETPDHRIYPAAIRCISSGSLRGYHSLRFGRETGRISEKGKLERAIQEGSLMPAVTITANWFDQKLSIGVCATKRLVDKIAAASPDIKTVKMPNCKFALATWEFIGGRIYRDGLWTV